MVALRSEGQGGIRFSPHPRYKSGDVGRQLCASPGDAGQGDQVDEALSEPNVGSVRSPYLIRALDQAGFLREYLPEFGAVAGLIRDELVHRYTVDEHTLRALDSAQLGDDLACRQTRTPFGASPLVFGILTFNTTPAGIPFLRASAAICFTACSDGPKSAFHE